MTVTAPYGSWHTPVTAAAVAASAARILELRVDGDDVLWAESRPAEAGRVQLVRHRADRTADPADGGPGVTGDLLPGTWSARTCVHEYGGAGWWVRDGVVWFVNWADQRLYRMADGAGPDGAVPLALTPEPSVPRGDRYADGDPSPDGTRIAAVRERHPDAGCSAADVRNEIVLLDAAPGGPGGRGAGVNEPRVNEPRVLVTGPDFVAAPRWSPDGTRLAYLRWNHPSMPWDDTELVVLDLDTGAGTVVAGGPGESVLEPRWDAAGRLLFLSDRTDRWNLYAWSGGVVEPVLVTDGEIGTPAWVFGQARYAVLPDGRVIAAVRRDGADRLVVLGTDGAQRRLDVPFTEVMAIRPRSRGDVVVIAGSSVQETGVHAVDPDTGAVSTLRPPRDAGIDRAYVSVPEAISFPSGPGSARGEGAERTAHALFYAPANPGFRGPQGTLPPLIVIIHGGPTAAASPVLNLAVQFWTTRGFAVVDVDYGGSTGYGRAYRRLLEGAWGIVDVEDCRAAASWLAGRGRVDGDRLVIRGSSAGGYTTLAALAREDTPFAAGADYFGVADLEALAADTHKFESRYLDRLVGPYPEAREVYQERSPLTHVDEFRRPLIVLQGSEDAVVPPKQSELIVEALRAKRVPVAYLLFEGEQHGFRRAENITRALEAELSFYAQVLGFPLPEAEGVTPLLVENL